MGTDVVTVETSDHARLRLTLSYNWHFDVGAATGEQPDEKMAQSIFSVRDFTGDACKAIASRVRGAVASERFDNFHKHSAKIIRGSVFGLKDGKVGKEPFRFEANNLVITNIDIQSVEPGDQTTRQSLQKSVQMAIEITTASQEAAAKHQAQREEEEAKGLVEQQRLSNQATSEKSKKELLELRAESNAVESSGQATAEAKARAETAKIEGEAAVEQARLEAEATAIRAKAELENLQSKQAAEIEHLRAVHELEIAKAKALAEIEAVKFKQTVDAIGAGTIAEIARAGPEMQAKLLGGLGIQGMLITDGKRPINLFQTAKGMVTPNPMGTA